MPFMILHDVILARNKNDRQGVAVGAWAVVRVTRAASLNIYEQPA